MSQKDVQDYLEKGMYGTPQLKPDEQRKYLGTFRERIYLSMTLKEISSSRNLANLKKELEANPNQQLLINAAVPFATQNDCMKIAQELSCSFKIIDTDNQSQPDATALVYKSDKAVNIEKISVSEKYPLTSNATKQVLEKPDGKKESWFGKLFN